MGAVLPRSIRARWTDTSDLDQNVISTSLKPSRQFGLRTFGRGTWHRLHPFGCRV